MKEKIRIASGQGFWGDLPRAPVDQVRKGKIDYLVLDYLAEVTMSILQKQRMKDPDSGYAADFIELLGEILPDIREKEIRVISNAGGVNPVACKDAILRVGAELGVTDLKVAVIEGDDILSSVPDLIADGHTLAHMEKNISIAEVSQELVSANVYFGSRPLVEALQKGADVVVTGRIIDAGLTLGPLMYEFNWKPDEYDKLAAGIIAGHIIECGGQASGGNFTDWKTVENLEDLGFPLIEAYPDASFHVTKHRDTGGLINEMTVKEQLLYEIADPSQYLTPDVIADFTSVRLKEIDKNRIEVTGVKGYPETGMYKVSAGYRDGYKITSSLVYSWPDAIRKAEKASDILKKRVEKLKLRFDDLRTELVGVNACSEDPGNLNSVSGEWNEVEMRISARGKFKEDLKQLGKEIIPLILTGPAGVTGYAGGRPKVSEVVAFWPALLEKETCKPRISIYQL